MAHANNYPETAESQPFIPGRVMEFVRFVYDVDQSVTPPLLELDPSLEPAGPYKNIINTFGYLAIKSPDADLQDGTRFMLNSTRVLTPLHDRNIALIGVYFGLHTDAPKDYSKTGREFRMSRTRVKDIIWRYSSMLRHPLRVNALEEHLDQIVSNLESK